jgi:FR47-like protein
MQQLSTLADIVAASGADPQCVWAAQGLQCGGGAWEHEGGVAVGCPGLSGRDRLVIRGPAAAAGPLVREAIGALGPSYVPIGDPAVMESLLDQIGWLEPGSYFGWMDGTQLPRQEPRHEARWLARREWQAADAILGVAYPDSFARPGRPGVRRWAGISDASGKLTSIAADAWSTPGIGFMAGVAVLPEARRSGQGLEICAFVLGALLAAHGRAALMVGAADTGSLGLCSRLGMTHRAQQMLRVVSASLPGPRRAQDDAVLGLP